MICFSLSAFLELFGETVYNVLDLIFSQKVLLKLKLDWLLKDCTRSFENSISLFKNIHFSVQKYLVHFGNWLGLLKLLENFIEKLEELIIILGYFIQKLKYLPKKKVWLVHYAESSENHFSYWDLHFEFVTKNRVSKFSKTHLKTLKQSVIKLLRECCILPPKIAERTLKF